MNDTIKLNNLDDTIKLKLNEDLIKLINKNIESGYLIYYIKDYDKIKELRVRVIFDFELI